MKSQLSAKFKMTDLGPAHQFLGIQIERNRQARTIRIHQKPYAESVLKRFGMEACNGVSTPMDPNVQLVASDFDASLQDRLDYQQAVGSIMYAMLGTRPDLAHSISTLSKFCANPSPEHAAAVKRVFRYWNKTLDVGITYGGSQNIAVQEALFKNTGTKDLAKGLTGLFGFTDSDWAGDKDTRKSTSGFLFTLCAISWKSTKQSVVATSSTEAEYIACSEAAKEALWLRRVMTEIRGTPTMEPTEYSHESEARKIVETLIPGLSPSQRPIPAKEPQIIFADNQGAIQLSKNPQHYNRTKHINVKYHFI